MPRAGLKRAGEGPAQQATWQGLAFPVTPALSLPGSSARGSCSQCPRPSILNLQISFTIRQGFRILLLKSKQNARALQTSLERADLLAPAARPSVSVWFLSIFQNCLFPLSLRVLLQLLLPCWWRAWVPAPGVNRQSWPFGREAEGKPTRKPCPCPCDRCWEGARSPDEECAVQDSPRSVSTCSSEKEKHFNWLCQEDREIGVLSFFVCLFFMLLSLSKNER